MGTRASRASDDSDRPPTAASEGGSPTATQKQDIFYSRKHLADPDAPPLPVGFAMGEMAPDVLRWLRRCEIFAAPEAQVRGGLQPIDYNHTNSLQDARAPVPHSTDIDTGPDTDPDSDTDPDP